MEEDGRRSAGLIRSFDLHLSIDGPRRPAEEMRGQVGVSPGVVRTIESHPVMRDDATGIAVHANLNVVPHVGLPGSGIARGP